MSAVGSSPHVLAQALAVLARAVPTVALAGLIVIRAVRTLVVIVALARLVLVLARAMPRASANGIINHPIACDHLVALAAFITVFALASVGCVVAAVITITVARAIALTRTRAFTARVSLVRLFT